MAILKWKRAPYPEAPGELDSLNLLDRFQDDWNRLLGWRGLPEIAGLFDKSESPAIDVVETEDGCTIWAEIPGMDRKDIELSVAANVLTLKGEKRSSAKGEKEKDRLYRDETWTGTFQRSLSLPDSIDPEKATAEFRDGVLKVTMAKRPNTNLAKFL